MEQRHCWETNQFSATQEIPEFHGTQKFIAVFTIPRHISLFWDTSIQSICPHPKFWISILILSSHLLLGLPSDGDPTQNIKAFTALSCSRRYRNRKYVCYFCKMLNLNLLNKKPILFLKFGPEFSHSVHLRNSIVCLYRVCCVLSISLSSIKID